MKLWSYYILADTQLKYRLRLEN